MSPDPFDELSPDTLAAARLQFLHDLAHAPPTPFAIRRYEIEPYLDHELTASDPAVRAAVHEFAARVWEQGAESELVNGLNEIRSERVIYHLEIVDAVLVLWPDLPGFDGLQIKWRLLRAVRRRRRGDAKSNAVATCRMAEALLGRLPASHGPVVRGLVLAEWGLARLTALPENARERQAAERQAVGLLTEAVDLFPRDEAPGMWASSHRILGLHFATTDSAPLDENRKRAVKHFTHVLELPDEEVPPAARVADLRNLARSLASLVSGEARTNLDAAIGHLTRAAELAADNAPELLSAVLIDRGQARVVKASLTPDDEPDLVALAEAATDFRGALAAAREERTAAAKALGMLLIDTPVLTLDDERPAELLREAAEDFERRGDPDEAADCHHGLGRFAADAGDSTAAVVGFRRAADLLAEAEQACSSGYRRVTLEESLVRNAGELVAALARSHEADPAGGWADEAAVRADAVRGRDLAAALADENGESALSGMFDERTEQAYRHLVESHTAAGVFEPGSELGRAAVEIREQTREAIRTVEAVRRAHGDWLEEMLAATGLPRAELRELDRAFGGWFRNPVGEPLTVEQLRHTADRAAAPVLTLWPSRTGVAAVALLPDGRIEARLFDELRATEFSELMYAHDGTGQPVGGWFHCYDRARTAGPNSPEFQEWSDEMARTLWQLSTMLWTPVREWLGRWYPPRAEGDGADAPPLVVVPVGALRALPIAALGGEGRYAADDYRITTAPSVRMLAACLTRAETAPHPAAALVVCNPTGHKDGWTLPAAGYEAAAVTELFPRSLVLGHRKEADREPALLERLIHELPRWPVALLSTHGFGNAFDPWGGSGVLTADFDGDPDQGLRLSVGAVVMLDLSRAWLVVLSACETAVTPATDLSRDGLGLTYAFLRAGAMTAVGTLWQVDSAVTAALVGKFFEELGALAFRPGSKGLALWRAQQWLRRQTRADLVARGLNPAPHEGAYDHPFWWGGFVCEGSP